MKYIDLKDTQVSRIAIGSNRLFRNEESVNAVHSALDNGVNFINCADFYNSGEGELAVGEALKGRRREDVFISVKFGGLMTLGRPGMTGVDVSPEHVENYLVYSLRRLGTDYVDLYQPSRINPHIPVEETIGAISRLVEKGFVRHIGITQVDGETLRRANAEHPISMVELNYNLMDRTFEDTTMATARELGIPISAFGVLLSGLIGGSNKEQMMQTMKFMATKDTFENIQGNLALADQLQALADEKGCTLAQLAIAWVLAQDNDIQALVGSRKVSQVESTIQALDVTLTAVDLERIEAIVPKEQARSQYMRDLSMNEKGLFTF